LKIFEEREKEGKEGYEVEKEGWKEEGWVESGKGWEGVSEFGRRMGLPDEVDLMIEAKGEFISSSRRIFREGTLSESTRLSFPDKEQAVLHLYNIYSLFPIANTSYLPPKPPTPPEAPMEGEDDGAALIDVDGNPIASPSKPKAQTPMAKAKREKAEAKVAAGKRREEREAKKAEKEASASPDKKRRKSPVKVKKEEAVREEGGVASTSTPPNKKRKVAVASAVVKEEEVLEMLQPEVDMEEIEKEVEKKLEGTGMWADDASDLSELEERVGLLEEEL